MTHVNLIDFTIGANLAASDIPFAALIAAAVMRSDHDNLERLSSVFPEAVRDTQRRYNAPGGGLPDDGDIDHSHLTAIADRYLSRIRPLGRG